MTENAAQPRELESGAWGDRQLNIHQNEIRSLPCYRYYGFLAILGFSDFVVRR
jgi:hypothetical protein